VSYLGYRGRNAWDKPDKEERKMRLAEMLDVGEVDDQMSQYSINSSSDVLTSRFRETGSKAVKTS
jgi:hypothetical protein